jgi:hypothetical protein
MTKEQAEKLLDLIPKERILAGHRKNAPILRLKLLTICKELTEVGGRGYLPEEDEIVFQLSQALHLYCITRAKMNDLGANTME